MKILKYGIILSLAFNIFLIYQLTREKHIERIEPKFTIKDTINLIELLVNQKLINEDSTFFNKKEEIAFFGQGEFDYLSLDVMKYSKLINTQLDPSHIKSKYLKKNFVKLKYFTFEDDSSAVISYYVGNNSEYPFLGVCVFKKNDKKQWYIYNNHINKY